MIYIWNLLDKAKPLLPARGKRERIYESDNMLLELPCQVSNPNHSPIVKIVPDPTCQKAMPRSLNSTRDAGVYFDPTKGVALNTSLLSDCHIHKIRLLVSSGRLYYLMRYYAVHKNNPYIGHIKTKDTVIGSNLTLVCDALILPNDANNYKLYWKFPTHNVCKT